MTFVRRLKTSFDTATARTLALASTLATATTMVMVCAPARAQPALPPATPAAAATSPAPQPVSIPSLDRPGGEPLALRGHWFPLDAASGAAPRPAVVLLHGCGGAYDRQGALAARYHDYAALLHQAGMHALVLDSLTARGEKELCTQKPGTRQVTQLQRRRDVLGALAWLAAQPGVDAQQLGLLGWSNGGSAVLAATNETHDEVRRSPLKARFAIAFYPGCASDLQRGYVTHTRLLMQLGASDDWTPAAPCEQLARQTPGVQSDTYPGAFHGFDSAAPVRVRKDVPGGVHPGQGVTVGGDPQAWTRSRERLRAFLAEQAGG